ncbi:hypothetical protein LEP1GSC178_2989 [Leptospira licerasiae str. MMD4847]|uniref:Uncharacterized protein n=1 Tax=Leptospira licerasiae str. MMD4847 TaxID=1049971 RepID=A0ABN0HC86_9LEPT|nr:hypothetical protein LEP1GSC178_2989 [Leptospira licerasiae str. MMD4847]
MPLYRKKIFASEYIYIRSQTRLQPKYKNLRNKSEFKKKNPIPRSRDIF